MVGRVQSFVDAGAQHIVVLFLDAPETTASAERFLREVVPERGHHASGSNLTEPAEMLISEFSRKTPWRLMKENV